MRTFNQLSSEEKTQAVRRGIDLLIGLMLQGIIEVEMPSKTSKDLLAEVLTEARKKEDPTLAKKRIMKSTILRPKIEDIAVQSAKGCKYDQAGWALQSLH